MQNCNVVFGHSKNHIAPVTKQTTHPNSVDDRMVMVNTQPLAFCWKLFANCTNPFLQVIQFIERLHCQVILLEMTFQVVLFCTIWISLTSSTSFVGH